MRRDRGRHGFQPCAGVVERVYTRSTMLKPMTSNAARAENPPSPLATLKSQLAQAVAERVRALYGIEHQPTVEIPPQRKLGDLAVPSALNLARELKRKPREIAQEIAEGLALPAGARLAIEGAGYLNVHLDRSAFTAELLAQPLFATAGDGTLPKVIVEHTNINPNKAAHIGHLRNAVLGDVLIRSLRALGYQVEAQNYIDDTGVQLADVVVGFRDLRGLSLEDVRALPEPFDDYCWDLYAEVGRWYEQDKSRMELRRATLHELEAGHGERAELGRLIGRRVVHNHLATMARLGIGYDLLTHESDILGLRFFTYAFERLKASGAVHLEAEGKNAGCWVMPLAQSAEFAGLEDPDKVIVRSDGTVTYVGKDIAYQLWKFGLLGHDFQYRIWEEERLWQTCSEGGVAEHPPFGGAWRVINVIDARQSYLQKIVRAGLQSLGHTEEADRSIHFAYEMVALSRRTAIQLGFLEEEDESGKSLEMSGRKGIGVKADDLLDQLEQVCAREFRERYPELAEEECLSLGRRMAIAALRYFMVRTTTTRVIAFDLEDAKKTQGETGPYLQYSLAREKKIRGKLAERGLEPEVSPATVAALPAAAWEEEVWDLVLKTAQIPEVVHNAGQTLELSLIARHAHDLAGQLHNVYHKYRILDEEDLSLRHARMAGNQAFRKGLEALCELLGVPVLERM
jgi:arginyl-tRNA synthetase